jgi:hypothetical protein
MRSLNFVYNKGVQTYARSSPDYVDARVLVANTAQVHTVPTGSAFVLFNSNTDFYAKVNNTVTVPSNTVSDGSAGELNPTFWSLSTVTGIGLISATGAIVTMSFYTV